MGRKNTPESDDKEQSARFIEAADRIQSEGAEEKFEESMKRILFTNATPLKTSDTECEDFNVK